MACKRAEEINLELLFRKPDSAECGDFVAHCADCGDCAAALQRQHEPSTEITPKAPNIAVAGAAVVIVVVIAVLAFSDRSGETPESASGEADQPVTATDPQPARATSQRIGENGRLSVSLADLREGDVLALDLEMPDEARGEGPRQVRVVDVERQRLLETTGAAVSGAETGLRIEIDPGWLQPGSYLIEVKTAEKRPLALRRYVLDWQ
jgi:hypothetical protein